MDRNPFRVEGIGNGFLTFLIHYTNLQIGKLINKNQFSTWSEFLIHPSNKTVRKALLQATINRQPSTSRPLASVDWNLASFWVETFQG